MQIAATDQPAPELITADWFNTQAPIALGSQRNKVIVIHAFQMLCPGCVSHGIPQAIKMAEIFPQEQVLVMGLHTVFEHHEVMNKVALEAFIHEYRLRFPVAIDQPDQHTSIPKTMALYGMQGTPTLIVIDKNGRLRLNHFGRLDDMFVGSMIGQLINEAPMATRSQTEVAKAQTGEMAAGCDATGCPVN